MSQNGRGESVTGRLAAAAVLARGGSISEAATAAGVARATVTRWRQQPDFESEVIRLAEAAHTDVAAALAEASALLASEALASVRVLAELRDSATESPQVRVASLIDHRPELLTFLDFPAEHWVHLRTTNPIESTFGTVKARTKKTRGAGSRAAALAMAFKLMESAQQRWRKVNASHLVVAVLSGLEYRDGMLIRLPESAPSLRDESELQEAAA